VQAGKFVRAFDPATGKVLWEVPDCYTHGHSFGSPARIDVGQTPAVLTGERGEVLRLSDGAVLGGPLFVRGPALAWNNTALGHGPDGVKAVRLTLAGDDANAPSGPPPAPPAAAPPVFGARASAAQAGLCDLAPPPLQRSGRLLVRQLWQADKPVTTGGRPAVAGGRLYGRGWVCDLKTGELVAGGARGGLPSAGGGYVFPMRLVVKGCELSIDAKSGRFVFRDVATQRVVGDLRMPKDPLGEANAEHVRSRIGLDRWMLFGAGLPYVWKDRLYIRAHDCLYCIGRR